MDFDRWFNSQGKKAEEPELSEDYKRELIDGKTRDSLYENLLNKPMPEDLPDGLSRDGTGTLRYNCRRCGRYDAEWCGEISEWDESYETFGCGSGPYCMP